MSGKILLTCVCYRVTLLTMIILPVPLRPLKTPEHESGRLLYTTMPKQPSP